MSSFLICSKAPDRAWQIDSWKTDRAEAERLAAQLVTSPYMDQIAAVFEVGGSDALPTFSLMFTARGQA